MYDYRIDKKIEELDPIPGTQEQKKAFIDSGIIPVAGIVQEGSNTYATKGMEIQDLYSAISSETGVLMAEELNYRTSDGAFTLKKTHSAGKEFVIDGANIQLPPGWYRYSAKATFTYTGTGVNKSEPIALKSNLHNQCTTINFDFSYPHTEEIFLSNIIHNAGITTDYNRVSNTAPLNTYQNFNLSVDGISAAEVSDVTIHLLNVEIQAIRNNE